MAKKQITIDIKEDGAIIAETFGFNGTECTETLDKLMKELATLTKRNKKDDYFKEKTSVDNSIKVKNG